MFNHPFTYQWQWQMKASPAALWPYVADTNRFDRDAGLPAYEAETFDANRPISRRRRLAVRFLGVPLVWEEEPFEWIRPFRFGVTRHYDSHPLVPLRKMKIDARLTPLPEGGTLLDYKVTVWPRGVLGRLAVPVGVGLLYRQRFGAVFRRYDDLASAGQSFLDVPGKRVVLAPGAAERLAHFEQQLVAEGFDPALVRRLLVFLREGDDLDVDRIRPYVLADHWRVPRQPLLELCLVATRLGLLDAHWDMLCPSCRGASHSTPHLGEVGETVHCEACNLDYRAEFDKSVELTFRPNPSIRHVPEQLEFCTAGPEAMPHIVAQLLVEPDQTVTAEPVLVNGRYRLRTFTIPGSQNVLVDEAGERQIVVEARPDGVTPPEACLVPIPALTLANETDSPQLFVLEEMAWSDQAATAADVTMLQKYRDLFATEALRPGDQLAVGTLTILFTDLCDSTRLYKEIGDALAFGLVLSHFEVLQEAVEAEGGVLVKTIGDAVMAAFRRPVAALRAVYAAQMRLHTMPVGNENRQLRLKAAVHHGAVIAVNLNGRLDYFGSTVNIASRLEKFASGGDIIISESVYNDPEVRALLANPQEFPAEPFRESLKGFDEALFALWRLVVG